MPFIQKKWISEHMNLVFKQLYSAAILFVPHNKSSHCNVTNGPHCSMCGVGAVYIGAVQRFYLLDQKMHLIYKQANY